MILVQKVLNDSNKNYFIWIFIFLTYRHQKTWENVVNEITVLMLQLTFTH